MTRAEAWYQQAKRDLKSGRDLLATGNFAQACFMAQQVAEKSLKALAYHRGYDMVKSHSLVKILADLKLNGELATLGKVLDIYYLTSRYPDALPDHSLPSDSFDSSQAEQALDMASRFLDAANKELT